MMDYSLFEEKMLPALQEMGLQSGRAPLSLLFDYLNYLLEENKHYNLTAITDPEEALRKHFLDSLTLLGIPEFAGAVSAEGQPGQSAQGAQSAQPEPKVNERPSLLDVGTGAGFPGLVLKLFLPGLRLLLLDSQQKRVNFLKQLAQRLKLEDVEVIHGRAEDLARDSRYRESFDWVVSRAVAPLNVLIEYTLPFSHRGGQTVLYKGPALEEELAEGKGAISLLGGRLTAVKNVKVPGLEGERCLVFIRKTASTPEKYPRRPGIPKKRPL